MNVLKNTSFDYEQIGSNRLYDSFQKKNKIKNKNESNNNEDSSSIFTNIDEHLFNSSSKLNIKSISVNNNSNSIHSLNKSSINNSYENLSKKNEQKGKLIEYIPDIFNTSSTENKKIMVSDLDIPLEIPNKKRNQKNKPKTTIFKENDDDFKKELEKNIIQFLEKNGRIKRSQSSTEKKNKITKKAFNNDFIEKMNIRNEKNNNHSHRIKNNLCLSIINSNFLQTQLKHRSFYNTFQKKIKKFNLYPIFNERNENKYKRLKHKNFLLNNISLTNCSTSCTNKGNNQVYYKLNSNNIKYNNNNKPKGHFIIQPYSYLNNNNKIFKTFCIETNKNEYPFKNKAPKNVKKISVQNQTNNQILKQKKNFIKNITTLNNLNKKDSIYSDEYKLLFSDYDKNKNKLFNKKMDIIDKIYHNNINFITTNFIKPFNFKLSERKKKLNKNINL